jgi:hypothetical protein
MNEEELEYEGQNEDGEIEEVKTELKTPFLYCSECESEYCDGSTCDNPNCPW